MSTFGIEVIKIKRDEPFDISSFPSAQKRASLRDTGWRISFSFLDRLPLLDVPLSERSCSSLHAPSQRLSRHERIDTDEPLRRQFAGHAARDGAGHQGNAWCVRPAPKMTQNGKGKGMGGTRARLLEIAILRGAGKENPCSFFCCITSLSAYLQRSPAYMLHRVLRPCSRTP